MDSKALGKVKTWFQEYSNSFSSGISEFDQLMQLKIEHSRHVSFNCRTLAEELEWAEDEIIIAEILGLLHDVGRFSQFAEYGTFIDADSVNHGERGYEVIRNTNILLPLPLKDRQIVLDGIHYHNCKKYPPYIPSKSLRFVKLVCDADKLDKFHVIGESIKNNALNGDSITAHTIQSYGSINPRALEKIRKKKKISKKHILSQADFYLMHLSLVFDIDYTPAFKRISDSKILEQIIQVLLADYDIGTISETVLAYVKEKI